MPTEQCYGVIILYKGDKENLFLILQHDNDKGSWSFPKGHHEGSETPVQTALRELQEETGIKDIKLLDLPIIHEEYHIIRNGEKRLKMNDYFIGFVKDKNVVVQESEISTYKWANYEEAIETLTYSTRKETLQKVQEYLNMVK